jgi:PAS domain S-box-containing protein
MDILCAEVIDRKDTMPRSGKNDERTELVRKGKNEAAKIEPLRPKSEQPDKLYNDLAKFPSENPYPVLRIHKDGTVLYANKAGEPLLKARGSGMGQPAPAEWLRLVEEVLTTGQVAREEVKDNGRVFALRAVPIADSNYVNFYGVDITEQKRAEEALRETTQTLEAVIKASPLPIFAVDRERIVKTWNPSAERTFGWSAQEVIGRQYPAIPKEKMDEADDLFSHALESGLTEVETLRQRKDGSLMDVIISAAPLRDSRGNINGVMAVLTDITERKRAEEQLQEERNLLRTLIDHIPDKVYVKDRDSRFIACNKSTIASNGVKREEELIGKKDFDLYEPAEAKLYFDEEQEVMKTCQPLINYEGRYSDKAGNAHYILTTKVPLRDSHGNVIGVIGLTHDITERKKTEQKLLEYQKKLKSLAARLTLAEERERRRIAGELHDNVSQSLALAKIKLDALRASITYQPLVEALKETCGTLEKAIQDTRNLTFDLSYPILYELGFEAAVAEWLNEQVQDKHGIATEFINDGQPKPLDDNVRVLLFRNVRELLMNVIKYANAGKVRVSVRRIDDSIEVVVEDNGVGFDTAEVRSLSGKRAEFGLFSVRESIEELGGSFEIESKPGAGCKATMTAPLKRKGIDDERNKATHPGNGN